MTEEKMICSLRPGENQIDRRIMYELTGVKYDDNDYLDDSSFDEGEQDEVFDGNGIGYGELSLLSQGDRKKSQKTELMSKLRKNMTVRQHSEDDEKQNSAFSIQVAEKEKEESSDSFNSDD